MRVSLHGSLGLLTSVDSLRHSTITVVYCSISACTTSSPLVELDRPMIESPGLVTLDHSSCEYCKTIWSSLTHALI